MYDNEELLLEIAEFLRLRGIAESTFGVAVCNDFRLVDRLRRGGCNTRTIKKARAYMAAERERLAANAA